MKAIETVKLIQRLLHVAEDGAFGAKSRAALELLIAADDTAEWPPAPAMVQDGVHAVNASSFADPADIRGFRHCKDAGGTDQFCFTKGDNGIGKWNDDCSEGSGPRCALPPEEWIPFGSEARGKKVIVKANGQEVICELRDTMPHYRNITNGAGLDLNPDAAAALGLHPPFMVPATWAWA